MSERLQKVLARAGVGSRRHVEELIREGRVTVNGRVAELGQRADLAADVVKVDHRRIKSPSGTHRYILVNKPRGCVSTVSDPEGRPTVLEILPERFRGGLKPVGRLDFETEGLLLLTDDGDLAHRITHPSFGCSKTYEVKVKGRPSEAAVTRLREGVPIDGRRTLPASVSPRTGAKGARQSVSNSWWTVTLTEGRTRQIREMFFRVGHPVQRLRRVAIGALRDPFLERGKWRELEESEVGLLQNRLGKRRPPAAKKRPTGGPDRRGPKPAGAKKRPSTGGSQKAKGRSRSSNRTRSGGSGRGKRGPSRRG